MTRYALINPQGEIDRLQTGVDPDVATRAGWKWLPVVEDPRPRVSALERQEQAYVVGQDAVEMQWVAIRKDLTEQRSAVKDEAQRRIIALIGARDFNDCIVKQLNANMRANELNDKRASGNNFTQEDEVEAEYLRGLANAVKALRAASNVLEAMDPIPLDFVSDAYWAIR